jgi:predicted cobalt transporter CbtA
MRGDPANVAAQLRRRMIWYFIGVVVCSALVYGIVQLYHYQVAALAG